MGRQSDVDLQSCFVDGIPVNGTAAELPAKLASRFVGRHGVSPLSGGAEQSSTKFQNRNEARGDAAAAARMCVEHDIQS